MSEPDTAPNVHRVTVGEGAFAGVYAPNLYMVVGDEAVAFIDTGYGKDDEVDAQLELWEGHGRPHVAAIVLTHRHEDHIGGAGRLQAATGGTIVSSPVEKEAIERALPSIPVGRTMADGERLDLGGATLEFIHTPGHTLGSMCIYHRQRGVLFAGDTILGTGTTVIVPDHGDMGLYIESLRKLLGCEARLIYPGHGPTISKPDAKIRGLIEHRLARERQIMDLLGTEGRDIDGLFAAIYTELNRRLHDTARSQIRSHLMKLEREGRVAKAQDGRYAPA